MRFFLVAVVTTCLFSFTVYAADDCDSEYLRLINELKESKMPDEEKDKYLPPLEKAYQLCKEGKDEEADKIVKDLMDQGLSEEVFDDLGSN